ncbi:MAG: SusD/RagB family nutrient-binding outer membrane lipoprotein [Phycisphaerae bacterium]|nr:SusD/RagB family nutrient-binding outer membrane lipoprotein [Saprospiraceae bacterium]
MNTNKFIALMILCIGLPMSSCKDYLDVNVDPNQSTSSRIDLQLTSAQLQTAIAIGQRIYPTVSVWSQYYTGGPGVSIGDPDQHKLSSSESNEVFSRMYRGNLNLNFIIKNSTENYYIAIAKIMQAYNFQVCVDLFGNIPFTDALKGDIADGSVLHPSYENAQNVVYPGVETLLKDAIELIEKGGAYAHPAGDDLIYHGDMDLWNKFAHTLLLKLYLRTGTALPAGFYVDDSQFITTNDENAAVPFPGGSAGSNPFWNAAKSTSLGNYFIATTTVLEHLTATADPRIDVFFDEAVGGHRGLHPGNIESVATGDNNWDRPAGALNPTGGLIFSPTAPVILMSAWEGNLLLAEAAVKNTGVSDLDAAYEAAVNASFEYLGLDAAAVAAYLTGGGALDAGNPIKSIALQKWTSMNGLQPLESWIETRRFDNAANPIFSSAGGIFKSPTKNALGAGIFPSILPYPENEESLNKSFPGPHDLTDKVFWDQ